MKIIQNKLIGGTLILTIAAFLTKVIGFYYRMFLSKQFGSAGIGIFQLVSPAIAISYAISVSGVQTAITKFVATKAPEDTIGRFRVFICGLVVSLTLSSICAFTLYTFSNPIAANILHEDRCAALIRIISLSLPFGCMHSCINGYFLGLKKTLVPAGSQLFEQFCRVFGVVVICYVLSSTNQTPSVTVSAVGLLIGEIASTLFTLLFLYLDSFSALSSSIIEKTKSAIANEYRNILSMAVPLGLNRVIVTILASIETILLPRSLVKFGLTSSVALSVYGVLTGMTLPFILFPCAITGSLTNVLMPAVSSAEAQNKSEQIQKIIKKTFLFCFAMGLFFTLFFFIFGKYLGILMFHNVAAGQYLRDLSLICPLLYISSALNGIINGLGKAKATLFIHVFSVSFRILSVVFFVPFFGVKAYIFGLIISQFICCLLSMRLLKSYINLTIS